MHNKKQLKGVLVSKSAQVIVLYGCSSAEACLVLSGEGDYFGWWLVVCNKIAHQGKESMVVEHETDRLAHCVHNQEAKSLECQCITCLLPFSFLFNL